MTALIVLYKAGLEALWAKVGNRKDKAAYER